MPGDIQYCSVGDIDKQDLILFFEKIRQNGDDAFFHPHPFDGKTAKALCRYRGKDLYYMQKIDDQISGYGMLRGWDEGYNIPSLGILIHAEFRGKKLGEKFMGFLHQCAERKGAKQIMLRVYPENVKAVSLYEKMGYVFSHDAKASQISGIINLG